MNRSQVVSALAPARQIGVQVRGWAEKRVASYGVGVFNGNGFSGNNNDDNRFLYAGRLALYPPVGGKDNPSDRLEIGLNAAYSRDGAATLGGGFVPSFSGRRLLIGGDFRLTHKKLLLSGEVVGARLAFTGGRTARPFGFHATAGSMLTDKSQILFRLDSFLPDGLQPDSRLVIAGYNLWPTKATELQVNYVVPTGDRALKHHQLLLNFQFAF